MDGVGFVDLGLGIFGFVFEGGLVEGFSHEAVTGAEHGLSRPSGR